jgi:hypothetical protein
MHKANLKGMNPVRAGRSVFARREEESAQKTQYQILVSFILKTPVYREFRNGWWFMNSVVKYN